MSIITDLVTKLRNERPEAKLGQQLYAIPQKANDMIKCQEYYYYTPSRVRTAVNFVCEACLELNYIKTKELSAKQYKDLQQSEHSLEELFEKDYLFPFLVFVNGRMIRWEYISLICVTEKYYLLIRGMDQDIFDQYFFGTMRSFNIVMLPDNVIYKDGGFDMTSRTLFAFDNTGAIVKSGNARTVIDSKDPGVSISSADLTDSPFYTISEDMRYSYFEENVLVFNNNVYDGYNDITVIGSVAKINGGNLGASDNLYVRAFYNTGMATPNYNNFHRVDFDYVYNDIIRVLKNPDIHTYLDMLKIPFDLSLGMNVGRSFEENRSISLDLIAQYNPLYFNEYYMTQRNFLSVEVDFEWVTRHLDEDGNLCIPRRFEYGTDFFIIVFVNGELYEYYRNHKYIKENFICPIQGIVRGDKVELMYFRNSKNYAYDMNIDADEPYLPLDTDYYYIDGETRIFCDETHEKYFEYDSDGLQHFPVDYSFEYDSDERRLRVRMDPFYYGKDLMMTNGNRFVYFPYIVNLTNGMTDADFFKIDLEDKFMYCNDYDRYLIFYNGRRLMNDHYRLVLPTRNTTPFSRFELYLAIPLHNGDRIEIFYLPHHFNDIYELTGDLNNTGLITIPKDKLPFVLDNHLFSFWLNGKKIPSSDIVNIDSTKVQLIRDQESLKTLRVTCMVDDKKEYKELKDRFHNMESIWDKAIGMVGDPIKLLGITVPVFTNKEPNFFGDVVLTQAIAKEVIRDWYMANSKVDITAPFIYDYIDVDSSIVEGTDSTGALLLNVADANNSNNFDVERPYSD